MSKRVLELTDRYELEARLVPRGRRQGRQPLNPGAGHEARALPGGPSVVTEGYRRSRRLPPTLVTKTGGPPGH